MASNVHPQLNWQPEPESRGTFNIISTCLTTLLFCTWTAVHTDISENKRSRSITKVSWLIQGIIVPEVALYVALGQLAVARQLAEAGKKFLLHSSHVHEQVGITCMQSGPVNMLEKGNTTETTPLAKSSDTIGNSSDFLEKKDRTWTLVHSFYAVMGGFAIGLPASKPFLPGFRERAILTPEGLMWFMEHELDLIPPLTEETIMDRSKANAFSKFVSLSQVLWFCANCISRLLQNLPLSLLEITTLAHASCTVATYLCWWYKPLNINEPTLIVGERALEICALMHMSGNTSADPKTTWAERNHIEVEKREGSSAQEKVGELNVHHGLELSSSTGQFQLQPGMVLKGTTFSPTSTYPKSTLDEVDVNRWRLASAAYSRYKDSGMPISVDNAYVVPESDLNSFVKNAEGTGQQLAIFVLLSIYGGLHFLGWNAVFPSTAERVLWQIATSLTASIFPLAIIGGLISTVTPWESAKKCILSLMLACYILAGLYLVVESCRQLFYLEPLSYDTASWSKYFPHFS